MKNARNLYPKNRQAGFTIVELIVIIVVIAILAAITIVSYREFTKQSQIQTAKTDAATAAAAINKYKSETGAYPTTLDQVTIAKTQSVFALVLNSGGTGNYCVQATFNGQVASVKQGNTAADEGGCAASGASTVTTITNVATNPSAENDLSGLEPYYGGVGRRIGGGAVSGASSFAVTTDSSANPQGLIHFVTNTTAAKQYTCAMSFKGTDGAQIVFAGRFTTAADGYISETGGPRTITLSSTSWTRVTIKFTTPTNTGRMKVQYRVASAAAGVTIQADALMCTQGTTDYNYADGDSAGWTWAGARQQSASSGPSTGVAPAN